MTAMLVAVAAAKIELAKPDQVADAQAQAKAANLSCDMGKIRFVTEGDTTANGTASPNDLKQKPAKTLHVFIYEVTCKDSLGYILQGPKGGSDQSFVTSCAALKRSDEVKKKKDDPLACKFPENQDLVTQVQPIVTKAGLNCSVTKAGWLGFTKDREDVIEVACAGDSPGYALYVPQTTGKSVRVINCLAAGHCTLTPPAEQENWLKSVAAKSGKACDVTKSRYVGTDSKDNSSFFEVACSKGPGFMIQVNAGGAYQKAIDCADAAGYAGGCTLTDKSVIEAAAANSWGQKLAAAGVACNVKQARLVGTSGPTKRDVVEYQCSDRPAGLMVSLPNAPGQKPDAVDCFDAHHFGVKCQFTSEADLKQILSTAFTAAGKSCAVSDYMNLGGYADGTTAFEVACGSAPGYIAVMPADYSKASKVQTCAEAAKTANRTGLSCSLPGNH